MDARKVELLSRGESYIKHIGAERVAAAVRSGRFQATTSFDRLTECDAILICVPTPLGRHREPDNSFIHSTAREIAKRLPWKAAEHGQWARFIELAGEINTQMPRYVAQRVMDALSEDGKPLKGSRVLVLGLAYKANIDDDRESPSYEILELLREKGAIVEYCDPYFPRAHRTRRHDLGLASVPCTPEAFAAFDALVVSTAHDQFKNPALYLGVKLVVDTRNSVAPLFAGGESGPRVVRA